MANNDDESLQTGIRFDGPGSADMAAIGNSHKTLPHKRYDEVDPGAYAAFKLAVLTSGDYESIPHGFTGAVVPPEDGFIVTVPPNLFLFNTGLNGHKNYDLPIAFTAGSPPHPS